MSDRTYGETRNCAGCRYWSEMLAMCNGCGPVTAYCLAPKGTKSGTYTHPRTNCESWSSGHLGAIDEPGEPPDYESENAT